MPLPRAALVLTIMAIAGLLTGCGSSHAKLTAAQRAAQKEAADVSVIRNWSNALRQGHVKVAAGYFARPSIFANGVLANGQLGAVEVHNEQQAEAVNESLSCGSKLTSAHRHGKYITADFVLTNRPGPGADCGSGTGESASVDFVIANGHIVDWIRAPAPGNPVPKVPTLPNPDNPGAEV